jgi:hypothetical protein
MPYDRSKAMAYAEAFWTSPCRDNTIATNRDKMLTNVDEQRKKLNKLEKDGWVALFVRSGGGENAVFRKDGDSKTDVVFEDWKHLEDCAHFLSSCVTDGGVTIMEYGVPRLVNGLMSRNDTKTLCEKVGQEAGQRVIDSGIFQQGDMMGYFKTSSGGYSHSAMYIGKVKDAGRITCHTVCRFGGKQGSSDDEWNLGPGELTYTMIHFSSDDPQPNADTVTKLPGWWKIVYPDGKKTRYHFILSDGHARFTDRAPAPRSTLPPGVNSAYWFQGTNKIIFCWRQTGTVEVWTPDGATKGYKVLINGSPAASVTKLF